MGFKAAGFPHVGFNPMGFKANINSGIINRAEALIWADRTTDGLQIDRIGRTTFNAVRPSALVGDGAMYAEVYKEDKTPFTDADLPVNYMIEDSFIYGSTLVGARVFGHETSGSTEFWCGTLSNIVRVDFYGVTLQTTTTYALLDVIDVKIVVLGLNIELWVNGELEDSGVSPSIVTSNEILYMLKDKASSASTHDILSHKITNTDTNEVLMYLLPQTIQKEDGTFNDFMMDASGNGHYAQLMVASAIPVVEDDTIDGSPLNELGYEVARALGKNLFNKDSAVQGYYINDGSLIPDGSWINYLAYLDEDIENLSFSPSSGVNPSSIFYDNDLAYIEGVKNGVASGLLTKPSNAKYVRVSVLASTEDTYQLEQGTTATTYEPWEGYYLDQTLTTPILDGTRIPVVEGTNKLVAYVDDGQGVGVQATTTNLGRVKYDGRIVDGVVDNGVDYENWESSGTTDIESDGIAFDYTLGASPVINSNLSVKNNTVYTMKYTISESNLTVGKLYISSSGVSSSGLILEYANGLYTIDVLTDSVITENYLRFVSAIALTSGERIKISLDKFYEKALGEPTSGEFVTGNSVILDEAYDLAVKADTNEHAFDKTDPNNVVSKLLECKDDTYGDYLFTSVTKNIVAMYETAQTGTTLQKIKNKLGLV